MGSLLVALFGLFLGCGTDYLAEAEKIDTLYPLTNLTADVKETSGLFVVNDRVWTFNDSGDKAKLYQVSMVNGNVERTLKVNKADNKDWESVASTASKVYIGDTGNNKGARQQLQIYELDTSFFNDANLKECEPLRTLKYVYPRDKGFANCEAMVVRDGRIYLFTKEKNQKATDVYSLDLQKEQQVAKYETRIHTGCKITDSYASASELVLLGYQDGIYRRPILWVFPWPATSSLPLKEGKSYFFTTELQTEGISPYKDEAYIISSEGNKKRLPQLWTFTLHAPTPK